MAASHLPQPRPTHPEWRRSGQFFLLAIVLHAAILATPLQGIADRLSPLPPASLNVKLKTASTPTHLPVAPAATPKHLPTTSSRASPVPPTRTVLAIENPAVTAITHAAPTTVPAQEVVPAPPVPPSARSSSTPTPLPSISAARFDAAYLNNPKPEYPAVSRRLGEEGRVLLKVRVSAEGLPATVDIETSSHFNRLDDAARRVVGRWRFIPARRGDEAIEASVMVPIVFRLEE